MKNAERIVGGELAPDPIQWQVSIQTQWGFHFCGGTILNKNTVLSAAHCFHAGKRMSYKIRAGSKTASSGGQV